MFNQLPATDTIEAIGRAANDAARHQGELGAFERGQLLSAFSATRHLAVEVTAYEPALRAFATRIGADSTDPAALAEIACTLLEQGDGDVRAALRDLVDSEVDLLAAAIEGS